ncbi:hypothetical protein ACFL27_14345 [candidate division CSSED10-310 bacterium]|uniref:DUF1574 domain-containing protein n=1 Tax=candidate division CSSED10-310 bacterium TaxID=2855610 RepID=A0ABV6YYU5_UNCC1
MKKFIIKTIFFTLLLTIILGTSMFYFPYLPLQKSLHFALLDKHERLRTTPSPRLIFIGGSNLLFGLNSKRIAETCNIDVVNAGMHAGCGLRYMLNDIKPFIQEHDVVVIVAEYGQWYGGRSYGGLQLLYTLFDVYPEGRQYISFRQWLHLLKFIPYYASSKVLNTVRSEVKEFIRPQRKEIIGVYERKAFNEYGDIVAHWGRKNETFSAMGKNNLASKGNANPDLLDFLNAYHNYVESKNAELYFLYTCFHESSFDNNKEAINQLHAELSKTLTFPILSNPERYKYPDQYFFNSVFHLNGEGVILRTSHIIEDLQAVIDKKH